jgi:hypothetical protein
MHVLLCGKKWRLRFAPLRNVRGDCDPPHASRKEIRIASGQSQIDELDTCLHEFLHAIDWQRDEAHVAEAATDIARILYRLGWRRTSGE